MRKTKAKKAKGKKIVKKKPGIFVSRRRVKKPFIKAEDWINDYPGTLSRWLHRYLPRQLGRMWRNFGPRRAAKDFAERNGCAICASKVLRTSLEVDHIIPKGPVPRTLEEWGPYIGRYFCHPSNLRGICKGCHKPKTKADGDERRKKRVT